MSTYGPFESFGRARQETQGYHLRRQDEHIPHDESFFLLEEAIKNIQIPQQTQQYLQTKGEKYEKIYSFGHYGYRNDGSKLNGICQVHL